MMQPDFPALDGLLRLPLLARIRAAAAASRQEAFLSGGHLRDYLLRRLPGAELDLPVSNPKTLLHGLQLSRGETYFLLYPERLTYRLVFPSGVAFTHLDITRLRAKGIEEDLRLRDFTVNALALNLSASGERRKVLDPTGGLADLRRRRLRVCSPRSLRDDPLRALRGIRLAAELGLRPDPATRTLIARSRPGLRRVSSERIRDELFRILQGPGAVRGVTAILKLGLLDFLGSPFHKTSRVHLPRFSGTGAVVDGLAPRGRLRQSLDTSLEYGVNRRGILRLAALLRDAGGEPRAKLLCRRLKLGKGAALTLTRSLTADLPRRWYRLPSTVGRGDFLGLFHTAGSAAAEAVILGSTSLTPASARTEAAGTLFARYRRHEKIFLRPPILTGRAAPEVLELAGGPALGKLLRAAKQAQDLGHFRDLSRALVWAQAFLRKG